MIRKLLVLSLVLGGCAGDAGISVIDAWARPTAPVADVAAFYVTLENGGQADTLHGASSDRCGQAEIHDNVLQDGIMTMRHLHSVEIGPGQTVEMGPAGMHVMCLGVEEPLVEGEDIALTLDFEYAGEVVAMVSVEER